MEMVAKQKVMQHVLLEQKVKMEQMELMEQMEKKAIQEQELNHQSNNIIYRIVIQLKQEEVGRKHKINGQVANTYGLETK